MGTSYRIQIATSVGERDGLAVELIDERGEQVIEVFRDDRNGGQLAVNSFGQISVPFSEFVQFIRAAEAEFLSV